jgi:predicted Rossmann fold nucleotide-binding protein DprA/Smf involved in DNA uptake
MGPDRYLGWLALALTPGLGARLTGKLLREFGSPEAIFNASLTALEAQQIPAAVAQSIHSRQAISAPRRNFRRPKQRNAALSPGRSHSIRNCFARYTIRRLCMLKEIRIF